MFKSSWMLFPSMGAEPCWDNINGIAGVAALTVVKRFYGFGVVTPAPVVVAT